MCQSGNLDTKSYIIMNIYTSRLYMYICSVAAVLWECHVSSSCSIRSYQKGRNQYTSQFNQPACTSLYVVHMFVVQQSSSEVVRAVLQKQQQHHRVSVGRSKLLQQTNDITRLSTVTIQCIRSYFIPNRIPPKDVVSAFVHCQ
jgi:hypothetical protein